MTFTVEPLADQDLEAFGCGNDALDDWLRHHAHLAAGQGTRTYVLMNDDGHVSGYFAIAPHLLQREAAPRRIGRGAPRQIPAVLLAKLALDSTYQGQGVGAELLVHALETITQASRQAGGKIIVVDAIDDAAAAFYARHDFMPIPSDPRRLVQKLSTVARALDLVWP